MRGAILLLLTALSSLIGAPHARADQASSTNWAGYAVHGGTFRHVIGTWREPAVTCRPGHETYSAYWIGLGGFSTGSQALEQIGTEGDCLSDGTQSLSAWYEMVPSASVTIPMTIGAGDLIDADVIVRDHAATLSLRDRTRHTSFARTLRAAAIDVTSAEWIVEAPSDCSLSCVTLPLADFGSAIFTSARVQPAVGAWGTLLDPRYGLTTIRLQPSTGHVASAGGAGSGGATPGAPTHAGSAFVVSFARGFVSLRRGLIAFGPR